MWLYDGQPEFIDLNVAAAKEGGYIVAMMLADGSFRLASTRQPARYVSAWRRTAQRYGMPGADVIRVLVSHPHLRYEAIKRSIASMLADHRNSSGSYRVGLDTLTEKLGLILSAVRG